MGRPRHRRRPAVPGREPAIRFVDINHPIVAAALSTMAVELTIGLAGSLRFAAERTGILHVPESKAVADKAAL
jgi:hypothetical protein